MVELLAFLLSLFWEVFLQVAFEILADLVTGALGLSFDPARWRKELALVGLLLVGGVVGGITAFIWPERLLRFGPTTGLSLFLSPLGTGLVMQKWGSFRRKRGQASSIIATFWGGAAFGLGVAVLRFFGTK